MSCIVKFIKLLIEELLNNYILSKRYIATNAWPPVLLSKNLVTN